VLWLLVFAAFLAGDILVGGLAYVLGTAWSHGFLFLVVATVGWLGWIVLLEAADIGARLMRRAAGARPLSPEEQQRLDLLLEEVCELADVDRALLAVEVADSLDPGAYAWRDQLVLITPRMFELPPWELQAALAHEVGHLRQSHHRELSVVAHLLRPHRRVQGLMAGWWTESSWRDRVFVSFFWVIWTLVALPAAAVAALLHLVVRGRERDADRYAKEIGFGDALVILLRRFGPDRREFLGVFPLPAEHPPPEKRIVDLRD